MPGLPGAVAGTDERGGGREMRAAGHNGAGAEGEFFDGGGGGGDLLHDGREFSRAGERGGDGGGLYGTVRGERGDGGAVGGLSGGIDGERRGGGDDWLKAERGMKRATKERSDGVME